MTTYAASIDLLLHYPAVIWLQYALLDLPAYAVVKATSVFVGGTAVLRRVPGLARVV